MLGMHGTYEANWAMHDCDFMLCIGARFDDRITGRIDAFSPDSFKVHIDIDPSSINKNIHVHVPIVGDVGLRARRHAGALEGARRPRPAPRRWRNGGGRSSSGAARNCLAYRNSDKVIKPQYALQRLEALTKRPRPLHHAPRSASTRCGRRSTWASRSRTAG